MGSLSETPTSPPQKHASSKLTFGLKLTDPTRPARRVNIQSNMDGCILAGFILCKLLTNVFILLPLYSEYLTVEWAAWNGETLEMFVFPTGRGTKKNIHGARQRHSKSEKPVMLLMHWHRHAHRAAQGSGVKEGFHLFYLSPLFRLHRAHPPPPPPFSLLQWGTDLNRADRNLPEWNAFLQ